MASDSWYANKTFLGATSATVNAGSGILGALYSYNTARSNARLLEAQAKAQEGVAERNIEEVNKNAGLQIRIIENERVTAEENTRAAVAAAGITQRSQTAQEAQEQNDREIAYAKWTVRQQAIQQTTSLRLNSRLNTIAAEAEAESLRAASKYNLMSGIFGAAGSVFSGAALAAG